MVLFTNFHQFFTYINIYNNFDHIYGINRCVNGTTETRNHTIACCNQFD